MLGRLQQWNVKLYFADYWEAYAELIPSELLVQTKVQTHGVERNNFCQRHWCERFRRKTCMVSRSLRMIDLTMSLYANFLGQRHINTTTLFSRH